MNIREKIDEIMENLKNKILMFEIKRQLSAGKRLYIRGKPLTFTHIDEKLGVVAFIDEYDNVHVFTPSDLLD